MLGLIEIDSVRLLTMHARGLLQDDEEWYGCLEEARLYQNGSQSRLLLGLLSFSELDADRLIFSLFFFGYVLRLLLS